MAIEAVDDEVHRGVREVCGDGQMKSVSCTNRSKTSNCGDNILTFDARHLFASSLVKKCDLAGDGVEHLHEIGQEQDDLDLVIAQVTAAADALSPLHMWAAQQSHCGALVQVLGSKSERK